jgi:hypothetical protein
MFYGELYLHLFTRSTFRLAQRFVAYFEHGRRRNCRFFADRHVVKVDCLAGLTEKIRDRSCYIRTAVSEMIFANNSNNNFVSRQSLVGTGPLIGQVRYHIECTRRSVGLP